jgi:hypothetical protein
MPYENVLLVVLNPWMSVLGSRVVRIGLCLCFLVVTVVLTGVFSVSAAFAVSSSVSPWWHLGSGSQPTNLRSGLAIDEVQRLTISATAGDVVVAESGRALEEVFLHRRGWSTIPHAVIPFNTTVAELQNSLSGEVFPGRRVLVSEESSGVPDTRVFRITFPGQAVGVTFVSGTLPGQEELSGEPLSGGSAEASVVELASGKPDGVIVATAENVGDAAVSGQTEIVDSLPAGVEAVAITGTVLFGGVGTGSRPAIPCKLAALACVLTGALASFSQLEVRVSVKVRGSAVSGEANLVSVVGGGAPSATFQHSITVSGDPTPFGIEDYELGNEVAGGAPATQAGSHPFQQTTTITLKNEAANTRPATATEAEPDAFPAALPKDVNVKWPPGLIGNPTILPRCSIGQFLKRKEPPGTENECPDNTAVGVASVTVNEPTNFHVATVPIPLFNLEPRVGEPARFGFYLVEGGAPAFIDTSVRTGGDYGINVSSLNITQNAAVLGAQVTVWGIPGDPVHDHSRGWGCLRQNIEEISGHEIAHSPCSLQAEQHPKPFSSLPTSCTGPLLSSVEADSWTEPKPLGEQALFQAEPLPALDGCNQLPFEPSIRVAPDGQAASTPTGLNVDVHVPQDASLNPDGLAGSDVKDITVTFPEGVVLNPAAADGLQACSEGQIGYLPGQSAPPVDLHFTPIVGNPFCPDASKVGTVRLTVPVLADPLVGSLYLAAQEANPFGSLIATYIVAEDPVSGVLVKLAGRVALNQVTGQITSTFENTPQAPFEDAEIHLFGGERAPFATPSHCGAYTTEATITPWSGNPPVKSNSSFNITTGPNGTPCPNPLPFKPSLAAGTTNINAGSFSPLTTTISRDDGNQDIQSVVLRMPPGISGILTGVKLCPEAQANAGTCGPESLIGHTVVSVGLGGDPFSVTGGEVFLTEKYGGAPFGLSIVNPAKAGPFDLGKVIVRAKIDVDPHTAVLTVTTGTIPHILDGIPLQIKHVNVTIDRPGFTFNPTNCNPLAVTGTISSVEGANAPVGAPFQVTNCGSLKFEPKFSVSTSGKTSRAKGASLTAKLAYPKTPQGTLTNIARVKVDLPKQLPSRLTTLQKACTNIQFETNPANCPTASKVGFATVTTPLLPVPLSGPAIFVSHGNEAFPSLTMVLQGYGVTVDLVGTTFISKKGITSTTFKTVPDVPFNTFKLTLPQGKYSALAANGNLCKTQLRMPTSFIAQNGHVIHQTTKITTTNCPKTHTKHHTKKHATKKHK